MTNENHPNVFNGSNKRPRNWSTSDYNESVPPRNDRFSRSYNANNWNDEFDPYDRYPRDQNISNFTNDRNHQYYQPARNQNYAPPNSTYLGSNYDPNYSKNKKANNKINTQRHELIPKKSTQMIDYKAKLERLKASTKLDASDLFKQAGITYNESWDSFIDPFRVLIAQRHFILAAESLKLDEKQSKARGPSSILSDDEFNQKLTKASDMLKLAPSTSKK